MIEAGNERERVVRLADGEDLMESLRGLPDDSAVVVCGIGMVRDLKLGYWNGRAYESTLIAEPCELLSLQGNLARSAGGRVAHCHVVVGTESGEVRGGHLLGATVANTAEISLLLLPGIRLERAPEPNGLTRLVPSAERGTSP